MTTNSTTASRRPARPARRAGRPAQPGPARSRAASGRTFSAPVVRELPPRRESRAAAGIW